MHGQECLRYDTVFWWIKLLWGEGDNWENMPKILDCTLVNTCFGESGILGQTYLRYGIVYWWIKLLWEEGDIWTNMPKMELYFGGYGCFGGGAQLHYGVAKSYNVFQP